MSNDELRELCGRLHEALIDRPEVLYALSHAVRTPLNSMVGFAQLLCLEPLPPVAKTYTEQILASGEELLALINEVFGPPAG